jgi:5'(3')-deoxyribonucleotidase
MQILLDCDGVICNFVASVLEFDNYNHTYESITDFNIFKAWGQPERWKDFTNWISVPGRVKNIKPFDGAIEFVNNLRKLGEVTIVTSPFKSPNWISERFEWLQSNFNFKDKEICIWSEKHRIDGYVLIDDAMHNVLDFPKTSFLLDAPWNQGKLPQNVIRCINYNNILSELNNYIKYNHN